jgi:hypothetical protein
MYFISSRLSRFLHSLREPLFLSESQIILITLITQIIQQQNVFLTQKNPDGRNNRN